MDLLLQKIARVERNSGFGGQLKETDKQGEVQKASKVLVFMSVNINGSYKRPVACYFSNSLTGNEKSILLTKFLEILHGKSIRVTSTTFDGDESNQRACKLLGANFDYTDKKNFKPYFNHPVTSEPLFVFFMHVTC